MSSSSVWQFKEGKWERALGIMERLHGSITSPVGAPSHWMVGSAVKFNYAGPQNDLDAKIRQAWITMRYRFPSIAAEVDIQNGLMVYKSPDASALEQWLKETLIIHTEQTVEETFADFRSCTGMKLYYFPTSSQLLIQATHDIIDGRGTCYFWDAFFTSLTATPENITWGTEEKNLARSENELVFSTPPTPSEKDRQTGISMISALAPEFPVGMPNIDFSKPPGLSKRDARTFSEALTKKIVNACHTRGITVTAAWHAALAIVVRGLQSACGGIGNTYATLAQFDMRPLAAKKGKDGSSFAVGCYHSAIPYATYVKDRSFDEISKELSEKYRHILEDAVANEAVFKAFAEIVTHVMSSQPPPSSTPSTSSLGVIDQFLRHKFGEAWELVDYWVADTMLTGEIEAFCWTWRGHLVVSGSYNQSYYGPGVVDDLLRRLEQELVAGLGINPQDDEI